MVAYSFQKRFAEPIEAGTKRQTIRPDRKRHARPGEELQLYTGMRTKHCKHIRRARCKGVYPIALSPRRRWAWVGAGYECAFLHGEPRDASEIGLDRYGLSGRFVTPYLEAFARADGFIGWGDLARFWFEQHEEMREEHSIFTGKIIVWEQ
ncbi:hypothetical protein [Methylosinus sp. Sm6]|uniref:hypothetical protein n=1 Tax=Methylosinus sp. Sm6 TaxID=2866948 RepID=UPI001C994712|nr:hypothetical protein [Methylosinus sp. Sm6]MBY6244162.1 hypothetical protein [Methylosinus sp. Sm6]